MAGSIKPTKLNSSVKSLITRNISSQTPLCRPTYGLQSVTVESDSSNIDSSSFCRTMPKQPPLSVLPLTSLLRSIGVNSVSSSSALLPLSLKIMSILAHSSSPILNPDQNSLLRWFLKNTFYRQFCAGENAVEVRSTVSTLKSIGFKGVMLCYAKEVVLDEDASSRLASSGDDSAANLCLESEILPWKNGTMETVAMTGPGDFVAVKFTGAGSQALLDLSRNNHPSPALDEAISAICDLAKSRGVRLLFDAEQNSLQTGIFNWTLSYMRKYNRAKAVVYCTYQAYLKAAPKILAEHLSIARQEGFHLGIKLVRGAYMASDPRHLIHDTKRDTDNCYDGISESIIRRQYGSILRPAPREANQPFPQVSLVLACHNLLSVRKAHAIRTYQAQNGLPRIDMVYAQLQGMADEISCELVQAVNDATEAEEGMVSKPFGEAEKSLEKTDVPQAYKYLVWGTTGECMKYLLRRAQENKDAVQRTREGRNAMVRELLRRGGNALGFGTNV